MSLPPPPNRTDIDIIFFSVRAPCLSKHRSQGVFESMEKLDFVLGAATLLSPGEMRHPIFSQASGKGHPLMEGGFKVVSARVVAVVRGLTFANFTN